MRRRDKQRWFVRSAYVSLVLFAGFVAPCVSRAQDAPSAPAAAEDVPAGGDATTNVAPRATGDAAEQHTGVKLMATGLRSADYLVVVLYLIVVVGMGVYLSRRQTTSEEYFVAGRRMPWFAVGLSMVATLLSTLTYLGTPGDMIKNGAAMATGFLAVPFSFVVVGYLWIPFYMRLNVTSAYEYLERRFGLAARLFGVVLFLWLRFLWMGVIVLTASAAIAQMTSETGRLALSQVTGGTVNLSESGWLYLVIVSGGLFATIYTTLGGIRAVIWSDVLQFAILFAGAVLTIVFVAVETGTGPGEWWANMAGGSAEGHAAPLLASWDLSTPRTVLWVVLSAFFWTVCTYGSDQVALQRFFSTGTAARARLSYIVNVCADISMLLLLATCGMALLTYYILVDPPVEIIAGVTDPRQAADQVFPHFIAHGLPVGVSGLVVAALFAVAMSSIDSGINSVSTVLTVDVFRRFREGASAANELRLARVLTLVIGVVVTAMGLASTWLPSDYNIIDVTMRTFNCELGPLAAMFLAGMLLPHVSQRAVLAAGALGAVLGPALAFWELWFPVTADFAQQLGIGSEGTWEHWLGAFGTSPSGLLIIPITCVATFAVAAALGGFLPGPDASRLNGLTWRSVVRGETYGT